MGMTSLLRTITTAIMLSLALLLAGCSSPFQSEENDSDPAEALRGDWVIEPDSKPVADWPHHSFTFTPANEYQILDSSGDVFERGPMSNVTAESFEYTVKQADHAPEIIGNENYAEYEVSGDELTITFYDNPNKTSNYGTYEARRP